MTITRNGPGVDMADLAQQVAAATFRHLAVPVPGMFEVERAESPYVFDAATGRFGHGDHDFARDLFSRSQEGRDRALQWMQTQFATSGANVAAAIPNGYRPDLAVDARDYSHPLSALCGKTPNLDNGTPFTFPVFASGAPLVAAHTEGTAPTDSTFVLTSTTVTPAPLSGRIQIPREVADAGGNPLVSDWIWQRMVGAYNDAREAAIAAALTAAAGSITDITLTAGAADSTLLDGLTAALAGLHYVRGGFRFTSLATQIDLYTKLVTAKDGDNRPLLPAVPGANVRGTSGPRLAVLDLAGIDVIPTPALAATGTVPANSWLLDPNAVHCWQSLPQRLDFEYRVEYVDLAIWGYHAEVVADPNGVRQVIYDPTA